MSLPILETKLFIPQPRPDVVSRPRLSQRLNAGIDGKLTLVSAPPGFGKTTLVSEWLVTCARPVAWLSLAPSDNDPTHFFTYLVASMQTLFPDFGQDILDTLYSTNMASHTSLAILLLNQLTRLPNASVLVLDDFHLIENVAVIDVFTFLLEHLPPTLHLVMITRQEPDISLSRLRTRSQLTELRAADLRFTAAETAVFLNQSLDADLSESAIDTLEQRTEGWIAGLQLATISFRDKTEPERYIEAFAGDHRFVVDYLVEEVLRTQPETIRRFLLMTSLLERFNETLCDAITGRTDSKEVLATLDRDNLFLIPLDETRTWYRYHHLFAEAVHTQLHQNMAEQVQDLHVKASEWFADYGFAAEAIHHAIQAKQHDRVATLIESSWSVLRRVYNEDTLIAWLQDIPEPIFKKHPLLNAHYAFASMSINPMSADKRLNDIEAWLNSDARTAEELAWAQRESIPGMIAITRASQAGSRANLADTIKYARQALELLPEKDFFSRGSAGAILGITHWTQGDLTAAYTAIVKCLGDMRRSKHLSGIISVMFLVADICRIQLKLQQAEKICHEAMSLAAAADGHSHQGSANIQALLSEIHYERGELDQAKTALQTGLALGEHAGLEVLRHRWYIAMAHLNWTERDHENAFANLDEAQSVYLGSPMPDIRPIEAIRTRLLLRQGSIREAAVRFSDQRISEESEVNHLNLYQMTTLARFLDSQADKGDSAAVNRLLDRLITTAETAQRTADLIDALVLKTLQTASTRPLKQALNLAVVEGAIQRFINYGSALLPYLRQIKVRDSQLWEFIQKIVARIEKEKTPTQMSPLPSNALQPLIESLSEREIEVLALMAEGKTNQQIADQLFLTLNTIKVHSRNIYGKLDVHNRTQAINRARTLGLLTS